MLNAVRAQFQRWYKSCFSMQGPWWSLGLVHVPRGADGCFVVRLLVNLTTHATQHTPASGNMGGRWWFVCQYKLFYTFSTNSNRVFYVGLRSGPGQNYPLLVSILVNACSMLYALFTIFAMHLCVHTMCTTCAMQPGQRVMQDKDLKLRSDRLKSWRAIDNCQCIQSQRKGQRQMWGDGCYSLVFSSRATWPSLTGIPLPVTISTLCSLHLIADTTILILIYNVDYILAILMYPTHV